MIPYEKRTKGWMPTLNGHAFFPLCPTRQEARDYMKWKSPGAKGVKIVKCAYIQRYQEVR